MALPILQIEAITTICQRALGWAEHRDRFTSLEDSSALAQDCRLRYDIRRRAVLEALDWGFARRRVIGQAVPEVVCPPGYETAWSLPPEMLRLRGVWSGTRLLTHKREAYIFTEAVEAPQIVYTADAHDPTLFPPVFTQALEFLLASEFSMLYARSVNRADVMFDKFRLAMDQADAYEAAERSETEAYATGSWVDAIECGWLGGGS